MASSLPNTKESLSLSLELANRVIQHASDFILITEAAESYHSPGSRIVFANEALLQQTGYSLEEVIGQTPRLFQGPNTDPETAHRIDLALANWQPIREEVLNYNKDGSEFWQELNIFPVANEKGSFTHWVAIQRNITERKLSEKLLSQVRTSLEESQRRLVLATAAGGVGIWDWDVMNDILTWDDQMSALYGIDKSQFTGTYEAWQNGLHPDDRAAAGEVMREALVNGEYKAEFRVVWPDTTIHYMRSHARAVKDSSGAITRWVGTNWDVTQQKLAEKRVEELAFFDHLTTLPNRRLFADRLQKALKLSECSKQYCALLSIDIDHFKIINDLHGHNVGDLVLQATAQYLLKGVRTEDTVARMGGDEFMILLEDLGSKPLEADSAAKTVADKILATFNSSGKLNSSISMGSLSIGITSFQGNQHHDIDGLMKQSDLALYQAKEAGRNCMKFYDAHMQASINARASLEAALRQGIQDEWFVLHYQSQTNSNQRINSAEVLVRLDHPQLGLIAPKEFICLAESTGLILPIGWWVLNAACIQLASWATQVKMAHLTLSVNISIQQFQQVNFVSELVDTVVRTGANPGLLTLELTETLFLEDRADAIQKMQALKDYGFNFSLDDFGTGYSSLSYLKSLPFDELKIDQTFVADIPGNQTSIDIVRIIILMGQTLGLKVIAEGVETKEQLQCLQAMGCHHYQGYLFSHAMPLDEFVTSITL